MSLGRDFHKYRSLCALMWSLPLGCVSCTQGCSLTLLDWFWGYRDSERRKHEIVPHPALMHCFPSEFYDLQAIAGMLPCQQD